MEQLDQLGHDYASLTEEHKKATAETYGIYSVTWCFGTSLENKKINTMNLFFYYHHYHYQNEWIRMTKFQFLLYFYYAYLLLQSVSTVHKKMNIVLNSNFNGLWMFPSNRKKE